MAKWRSIQKTLFPTALMFVLAGCSSVPTDGIDSNESGENTNKSPFSSKPLSSGPNGSGGSINSEAPVIQLNSYNGMTEVVEVSPCENFQDPGALVIDNSDPTRLITASNINDFEFDEANDNIQLIYTATDTDGNTAASVTRTVKVTANAVRNANELMSIDNDLSADYEVCNNVNLSGISSWSPIGGSTNAASYFTGSLIGKSSQNLVQIQNLKISGNNHLFSGLFGKLGPGSTIKNLHFVNALQVSTESNTAVSNAGLLAGEASGTLIENIQISGSEISPTAKRVGGLVGWLRNNSQLKNLSSTSIKVKNGSGSISSGNPCLSEILGTPTNNLAQCLGGAAGLVEASTLENLRFGSFSLDITPSASTSCSSGAAVLVCNATSGSSAQALGGLVGFISKDDSATIKNSEFHGAVQHFKGNIRNVGGIVGVSGALLENNQSSGLVTNNNSYHSSSPTGGSVGWQFSGEIKNSGNYSIVKGFNRVGGVVGCLGNHANQKCFADATSSEFANIKNSFSWADLIEGQGASPNRIGGIVGLASAGKIQNSFAENTLVKGGQYVGGIAGELFYINAALRASIENSYVAGGEIQGEQEIAGIAGKSYSQGINEIAITNTYSTAIINSTINQWNSTGGITSYAGMYSVAENGGDKSSFWLQDAENSSVAYDPDDGQPIATPSELFGASIYLEHGWDPIIWHFENNVFPELSWEQTYNFLK